MNMKTRHGTEEYVIVKVDVQGSKRHNTGARRKRLKAVSKRKGTERDESS
ncbi:hypothetical protein E2C01_087216 [Portunus trituberculatus]|uniref:Uncharacterized protein n=1 Tax=Portunus trituberculatus TaxID=210409 RepID=A0A5B7JIH1_PORTR|nr:hypothetical protein [Portunus trituberculatus]